MRPETRAYIKANKPSEFVSGDPDRDCMKVTASGKGGVLVIVDDYPDGVAHPLTRAETVRLRDWLNNHLSDNPGAAMAECAAQMDGDDKRTVAHPQCGWCGRDHLAQLTTKDNT